MAKAVIRNVAERRLRALKMLEMRVNNAASFDEIGKAFNLSTTSVKKNLDWARKAGLVADAEDKILEELVPAAHEAIKLGMKAENKIEAAKIGLEVFRGTIAGFQKTPNKQVSSTGGDDLDSHLAALRAGSDTLDALDGETVEGLAARALPPAETEASAERIPAADFIQPSLFGDE